MTPSPLEGEGEVVGEERAVRIRVWGLRQIITIIVPTSEFLPELMFAKIPVLPQGEDIPTSILLPSRFVCGKIFFVRLKEGEDYVNIY